MLELRSINPALHVGVKIKTEHEADSTRVTTSLSEPMNLSWQRLSHPFIDELSNRLCLDNGTGLNVVLMVVESAKKFIF